MSTIFSKIIKGEIPSYKVAEDENFLAFLDIFPLKRGHLLVIPKKEEDYFFDLPNEEMQGLMVFAKKVAVAMKKCLKCERIGMTVIGLEVAHAHVHLIPIDSVHDMNFANEKLAFSQEEFQYIAKEIASNL